MTSEGSLPLEECIVFLDVKTGGEDASSTFAKALSELGAMISPRLTPLVSHVVFKEGSQSTTKRLLVQ